jgi:ABC-type transporter Mla subunit MlaD
MRRALAILTVIGASATFALLGTGAGDDSASYQVRAIFQNAFSLVPGEDVKIAGVKVGKIDSLDVTEDQQAVVVFTITRAGFDDFREDAECTIRPQSLIGEKFIECTLTQPHPAGEAPPPALKEIPDGQDGAGQHLLDVAHTARPVDIDLVNNIMRLPFRQRLGIIINEFGTGLAARGEDLREVIRNADPALKATDKVLNLLASQNKVLANLARNSDISLTPLAREKKHLQDFVVSSADLATATAERQDNFRAQFEKLPTFLRELRPTMNRLGEFADTATPVLADLHAQAPNISRVIKALGPFSSSSTVALQSLGKATIPGRKALVAAKPIVDDLASFGKTIKPLARSLKGLTTSLKQTGGIERLLDYLFYQVAAINGYDQFGHYLRASLIVNLCSTYATADTKTLQCSANFEDFGSARTADAGDNKTARDVLFMPGISLVNRRTAAVLRGMKPAEAIRLTADDPEAAALDHTGTAADTGGAQATSAPVQTPAASIPAAGIRSTGKATTSERLLDYLLGDGA